MDWGKPLAARFDGCLGVAPGDTSGGSNVKSRRPMASRQENER